MKRRDFLGFVGAGLAGWPAVARAQQGAMPVIGFLNTASPEPFADFMRAFRAGLSTMGYVEGRNVAIEYRWAEGRRARVKEMAADLVARHVDVIAATGGSPAALDAKAATTTIPIVFQVGVDPIEVGLVSSMTKPGGNVTGATMMAVDLVSKRLELLHELAPNATSIVALLNPASPGSDIQLRDLKAAADKLGLRVHVVEASTEADIGEAFKKIADLKSDALLIGADPLYNGLAGRLAALALQYRIPSIYQSRSFAAAGGLLSYGGSIADAYHQVGVYTGRVLKGDKPRDLPVLQSTKVELVVNLKTAKAFGVTVPLTLLGRADEIIE